VTPGHNIPAKDGVTPAHTSVNSITTDGVIMTSRTVTLRTLCKLTENKDLLSSSVVESYNVNRCRSVIEPIGLGVAVK